MSSDITQEETTMEETSFEETSSEQDSGPELDLTDVITEEPTQDYTPEPEHEQQQEQYQQPQQYTLADQVSALGFTDVQDDHDAQYRLRDSYQQLQNQNSQWADFYTQQQQQYNQQQQMAEYGQEYLDLQRDPTYQQYQQQQQAQYDQQQQQPAGPEHWWAPPEVDMEDLERWRTQKVDPHTGQIYADWVDGTPQELKEDAEDYVAYLEDWADNIIRSPQDVLPGIIEQEFDKLFKSRYTALLQYNNQYQQEVQNHTEVNEINQRNADWVYQVDPRTNQYLSDANGNLVLSPQGQAVTNYINYFREQGITDPSSLWELATRMYSGDLSVSQQQQQQQQYHEAQQAQQRNMEYLQQANEYNGYVESAGGSIPPTENPMARSQNASASAGDKLRQQALADGFF